MLYAVARKNVPQIYWGHDLDLSGSRDVICHVTIRSQLAISYWWSFGTKFLPLIDSEIFYLLWALEMRGYEK